MAFQFGPSISSPAQKSAFGSNSTPNVGGFATNKGVSSFPSSFGTNQAFGMSNQSSSFGMPASSMLQTGAPSTIATSAAGGVYPGTRDYFSATGQLNNPQVEFSGDTNFNQLPQQYRSEIERVFTEMKAPLKRGLLEISTQTIVSNGGQRYSSTTPALQEVKDELRKLNVRLIHIENTQSQLLSVIKPHLEHLRVNAQTAHLQGSLGLRQIHLHNSQRPAFLPGSVSASELGLYSPDCQHGLSKWFAVAAEQIEQRLQQCVARIAALEKQLATILKAAGATEDYHLYGPVTVVADHSPVGSVNLALSQRGQNMSRMNGDYGQLRRIGPQQALSLLKDQMGGFLNISSAIAQVHAETDTLREAFKQLLRASSHNSLSVADATIDPFAAADRAEASDLRRIEQKLGSEAEQFLKEQHSLRVQQQSSTAPVPAPAAGAGAGAGAGSSNTAGASLSAAAPSTSAFSFSATPPIAAPTVSTAAPVGSAPATVSFATLPAAPAAGGAFGFGVPATSTGGGTASGNKKGKSKK